MRHNKSEVNRGRVSAAMARAGVDPQSRFNVGVDEEGRTYYEIVVSREETITIYDDTLPGPPS